MKEERMDGTIGRMRKNAKIRNAMSTKIGEHKHNELNNVISGSKSSKRKTKINYLKYFYLIASLIIFSICVYSINLYLNWRSRRLSVTPFDYSEQSLDNLTGNWGTLRSGLYFGVKSIRPQSPVAGLMWNTHRFENRLIIRHWCDQGDALKHYAWKKHDFENFGEQLIIDQDVKIQTKILFDNINKHSRTWKARISISSERKLPFSFLWYYATESDDELLELLPYNNNEPMAFTVKGHSSYLNNFLSKIKLISGENILHTGYKQLNKTDNRYDNDLYKSTIMPHFRPLRYEQNSFYLPILPRYGLQDEDDIVDDDEQEKVGKQYKYIITQFIGRPPFEVEITFKTNISDAKKFDTTSDFDKEFKEKEAQFDNEFNKKFNLIKNFAKLDINANELEEFAKAALSNLLGGVGYFYGSSLVRTKLNEKPLKYGPHRLLTAVPSRSFFPRGFLWDEGFHNLLISSFLPKLSLTVIESWLHLMNVEGWIPREVILGFESAARVPTEFIVQHNDNANPPTLFLALENLLVKNHLDEAFIKRLFPRLQRWYNWFNETQAGSVVGTYRWRGRNKTALHEYNVKTLTSGFDDYPRSSHPTDDEYHLDLRCWITLASRVMSKLAKLINHSSEKLYSETEQYLSDNNVLDKLHWSDEFKMYCDFGLHSLNVEFNKVNGTFKRLIIDEPKFRCVPEFGYVSLFPFILRIIKPDNSKLGHLLDKIESEQHLLSEFGLRSLSKSSIYYRKYNTDHDAPYWRGPIWININYLMLNSLNYYSNMKGPYSERCKRLHDRLRLSLVKNLFKEYKRTGYIWENYDDRQGFGKGSHPFTGWSSLILLVLADQ